MAQFTIYRSTDAGSPVLNGLTGSLITVLDAVLVNGYGTQTAAGWTKPYSASGNTSASYKQGISSSGMYMWVMDTGSVASGREAIYRGFQTMSSANASSGINPFPTAVQSALTANGVAIRKSGTLDSVARRWIAAADSKTLYFFTDTGDSTGYYMGWGFGDITSFFPNDQYKCMINGRNGENYFNGINYINFYYERLQHVNVAGNNTDGAFICNYIGGGSIPFGKAVDDVKCNLNNFVCIGNGVLPLPNYPDGKFYMSPVYVQDVTTSTGATRGRMRGFWASCHPLTYFGDGNIISGIGPTNISVMAIPTMYYSGSLYYGYGTFLIEISNTLD